MFNMFTMFNMFLRRNTKDIEDLREKCSEQEDTNAAQSQEIQTLRLKLAEAEGCLEVVR